MSLTKFKKLLASEDPLYEKGYCAFTSESWKLNGYCEPTSEEDKPKVNRDFMILSGTFLSYEDPNHPVPKNNPDDQDYLEMLNILQANPVVKKAFLRKTKIHLQYRQETHISRLRRLFEWSAAKCL